MMVMTPTKLKSGYNFCTASASENGESISVFVLSTANEADCEQLLFMMISKFGIVSQMSVS